MSTGRNGAQKRSCFLSVVSNYYIISRLQNVIRHNLFTRSVPQIVLMIINDIQQVVVQILFFLQKNICPTLATYITMSDSIGITC